MGCDELVPRCCSESSEWSSGSMNVRRMHMEALAPHTDGYVGAAWRRRYVGSSSYVGATGEKVFFFSHSTSSATCVTNVGLLCRLRRTQVAVNGASPLFSSSSFSSSCSIPRPPLQNTMHFRLHSTRARTRTSPQKHPCDHLSMTLCHSVTWCKRHELRRQLTQHRRQSHRDGFCPGMQAALAPWSCF